MNDNWIKTGAWCGVVAVVCYLGAAFAPLPATASIILAFHFGILLAVSFIGLSFYLSGDKQPSIVTVLMKYAGIIAGAVVTTMLTVQQSFFISYQNIQATADTAEKLSIKQTHLFELINTVHLGLDVCWDLFISWAGLLLGIAMLRSRKFWKLTAWYFIIIHASLLALNLATFPVPPGDAGLIDLGPFIGLSYLVLNAYILLKKKKKMASPNVLFRETA